MSKKMIENDKEVFDKIPSVIIIASEVGGSNKAKILQRKFTEQGISSVIVPSVPSSMSDSVNVVGTLVIDAKADYPTKVDDSRIQQRSGSGCVIFDPSKFQRKKRVG